jgi:hypothetical protein
MQTPAEKLAHCMLTRNGLAAISDLQWAADFANGRSNSAVAASLLEIAEAAEQKSGYGGTHALPSELN